MESEFVITNVLLSSSIMNLIINTVFNATVYDVFTVIALRIVNIQVS